MVQDTTTHSFVPYLPGGNHEGTDEAVAAPAGGTGLEGHRRALEGGHPLSSLQWTEAALGAQAIGAAGEPKGARPAASRDGRAWPCASRDLSAGPAARRLLDDLARSQPRTSHHVLVRMGAPPCGRA